MRQFVIDELSFLEHDNLDSYLKRILKSGPIEGVFWLELPQELLAPPQLNHPDCGPFYFSVILEKTEARIEFLVRSSRNIRCSCIDWATPEQRNFVLDFIDNMIKEEYIMV
ncbi:MAG: hypothetical protein WGN25_11670 [Candidatus Electrothrix sp. GW3-4]|uniref:hypothetical protein n=1 Tax=Candidatus Electrothrix sp. GW3-4 TaxID=3126740 RepID=UPI0030CEA9A8